MTFKDLQSITKFAKRHKIERLKFGEIEIQFSAQGLMTASEKKEILKLVRATPKTEEDRRKEFEDDLFHSA